MNQHSKTPSTMKETFCQECSSNNSHQRLSSFICDHCQVSMCYDCFEKHSGQLSEEYSHIQKRLFQLKNLFHNKKQLLANFEEHCLRSIHSTFDDIIQDIENLRKESIHYVKQQFQESELLLSNMMNNLKPFNSPYYSRDIRMKTIIQDMEIQRKQINDLEKHLQIFTAPIMQIQMSTLPRNKFDLHCQLLSTNVQKIQRFSPSYPGKLISTKCTCHPQTEHESEKIDVDTEVEEFNPIASSSKETQTDSKVKSIANTDDDDDDDDEEYFSFKDDLNELSPRTDADHLLSIDYLSQGTIRTQYEVDRIASDGEHLFYFSDTSRTLCYIMNTLSDKYDHGISSTKEITCRWPHHPILDLVYSPISKQFICATKTGIYTCTVHCHDGMSSIDIQMQLTQHWSYVRLATNGEYLWLWTDTPRLSQLAIYSPKTFDCIKSFKLTDYPRFSDNSTSFYIEKNILATVFQYKQTTTGPTKKYFHVILSDSTDLHEICTIRLGECDIDHEIRANENGQFFLTNGRRKLWILDRLGKKEYVKLHRTGRALTLYQNNQIIIANGTRELECVELL